MTYRRDNWYDGMEYRARDDLFVELPQIFNAATAARDHDEIEGRKYLVRRGELANGHRNFLRCAGSLHAHRVDQNLQPRRATTDTLSMSRTAAPLGEVTIPTRRGNFGNGRFRSEANNPSASSFRFSASNFAWSMPTPRG